MGRATAIAVAAILAAAAGIGVVRSAAGAERARPTEAKVRAIVIHYRAHNGARRNAYLLLPSWYGPKDNPRIPLIISPHGRGLTGRKNARLWGTLPALGAFAVINPEGQGRRLVHYSWGAGGQVEDLARMPEIARRALPWLRIDRQRIYAFGGSMGGQETLLLVARHPRLLAGAAAFDAVSDMARQYREWPRLGCNRVCRDTYGGRIGSSIQSLARYEIGGTPTTARISFRLRSPLTFADRIAHSCVPLQLWWSSNDRIVIGQQHQSGRLFDAIRRANPDAPVQMFVGNWVHSAEMRAQAQLPFALAAFDLLSSQRALVSTIRVEAPLWGLPVSRADSGCELSHR
jgi:dipeptidyl aminopeptidase/acylaminoacyl peptidase